MFEPAMFESWQCLSGGDVRVLAMFGSKNGSGREEEP